MKKVTKTAVISTEYEIDGGLVVTDNFGGVYDITFVQVSTAVGADDDGSDFVSFQIFGYPLTKAGTRRKNAAGSQSVYLPEAKREELVAWLEENA